MSLSSRPYAVICLSLCALALQAGAAAGHQHHATAGGEDHSQHLQALQEASPQVKVSTHHYMVPDRLLTDEKGQSIKLGDVLADDQPLVVNFIYTTCTTICPVSTATQLQLQRLLASAESKPRFVSISIDPDFDTAQMLRRYAARHGANWTFLTGKRNNVLEILGNFDAWRGSKGNHVALTLMRRAGAHEWTRIEGLASAQQLATTWNQLAR